ncbi:Uncharacterized protein MNEG_3650 [Monoraphidium neglectum]|uniref:AAA+ ATPase domain-containing protein n=1 Tax=Monoraphidium neglectum TaxID=145388 RepID=A0A0D2LC27_9CHLO|nr:Uncharacterized protein MNEG_3650 [Monoraphidium neglectum]KIZ04304.1 Uncharacterized protein MNEG_3650 [Monoraphidium neglectum]|eukprot:XP_013903323.1 Uncharacterized protein MNEG_3650 [Monoraphidium neglectum]
MRPVGALHHARSALRGWGASSGWRIQQRALRSAPPTLFYARGTGSPHGARPALYEQQCFAPRWLVCSLYSDAGASVAVAASAAEAEANGAPEASEAAEEQDAQAHQLRQEQQQQWEAELEETLKLVHLLPESVRTALESHDRLYELLEVVMDLGRPPLARFPSGDLRLSDNLVTAEDLEQAVAKVGEFGGDNRAGIDATLHRISAMRNRSGRIVGLTCRVGRAITGSAELVRDLIVAGSSILFLGRPGVGKTTAIRELCRLCADELSKRVVIVDTSNEIGGDGDVPHAGIGRARRMQVADPEQQHRVMIEAVENHMPQVVVIDEIGTEAECSAARTIAQRGVQLFATAHGNELENVVKNPALSDLKSIQERAAPATFDVAVEMLDRMRWHVHTDVGAAVDAMLAGQHPGGQSRERAADGTILKYNYNPAIPSTRGGVGAKQQARSPLPDGAAAAGGGGGARSIVLSSVDDGEGALRTPPAGARGGGFVRRSVPVAGKEKGPVSGSIVTRRGRRVQLGTDSPEDALLRLHIADLDEERVWEVMTAMALHDK